VVPLLGPASPASNPPGGWDDARGWWKQLGTSRIIYIYKLHMLERPFCTNWRLKNPSEFPLRLIFIYYLRISKF
jgi:hypothetical protein